jgi:hypothetical protein
MKIHHKLKDKAVSKADPDTLNLLSLLGLLYSTHLYMVLSANPGFAPGSSVHRVIGTVPNASGFYSPIQSFNPHVLMVKSS